MAVLVSAPSVETGWISSRSQGDAVPSDAFRWNSASEWPLIRENSPSRRSRSHSRATRGRSPSATWGSSRSHRSPVKLPVRGKAIASLACGRRTA